MFFYLIFLKLPVLAAALDMITPIFSWKLRPPLFPSTLLQYLQVSFLPSIFIIFIIFLEIYYTYLLASIQYPIVLYILRYLIILIFLLPACYLVGLFKFPRFSYFYIIFSITFSFRYLSSLQLQTYFLDDYCLPTKYYLFS